MSKIFNFLFGKPHNYSIVNKFNIGDICIWPHDIDGCMDAVVEISNYFKDYDENTNKEFVLYDFTDIDRGYEYSGVNEKELQLLATNDELLENVSPYQMEFMYKNVV